MAELLNLVGLSAGIVLYAMLLAMVVRASRTPGVAARFDPLLLGTAVLGLIWNLCALPAYELPKVGIDGPFPFLSAVGFSALGFLPAVVVHSVLRGKREGVRGGGRRSLGWLAYSVSAVAATLHIQSAWTGGPVPSVLGMRLLTYTFVALIAPLAAATRGQPGARRALWAAALATFAVSALHLTQLHRGDASWPVELLGHHASLPLAFAILYQDYPFALADLFLKRALALLALLAVAFSAVLLFGQYSPAFDRLDPREVGVLVTLCVTTALLYPSLRRAIAWFVDTVVLHRPGLPVPQGERRPPDPGARRRRRAPDRRLRPAGAGLEREAGRVARVGPAAGRRIVRPSSPRGRRRSRWCRPPRSRATPSPSPTSPADGASCPTTWRRIDAIAVLAARRIDAIRITNERYEREIREQEIGKLATEAELRALRAQVNPHFLFNALTTIGHLIQTAPPRALETLMRLTSLLRAVLRSEGEFTTLGRELEVVEAYLDIERARFEDRLRVTIDVPTALAALRVPPLLLQPIVENAVKHGISTQRLGGDVTISARVDRSAGGPARTRAHRPGLGRGRHRRCASPRPGGRRRIEQRRAPAGVPVRRRGLAVHSLGTERGNGGRNPPAGRPESSGRGHPAGCRPVSARLRVIVADDERPARAFLVTLLRAFDDVLIVGEAASGKEAVTLIEKVRPDLALLDWQMPELDGIGVVKALKKQDTPLIAFVTAYDEYAVRAFRGQRGRLPAQAGREGAAARGTEPRPGADGARGNRGRAGVACRRGGRGLRGGGAVAVPRAHPGAAA